MSHESLSALLDGECTAEELDRLLDEMERAPALKEQWSRLCLARESAGGTHVRRDQSCICAGVMAGLDDLPAEAANPRVVELAGRRRNWSWKPLAGLAAAASVAAVALMVGFNHSAQPELGGQVAQAPAAVEAVAYQAPVQSPRLRALAVTANGEQQWVDAGDDLDNYLIEHSNSVAGQGVGMGGTLRYARFAAHTAAYHPDGQP